MTPVFVGVAVILAATVAAAALIRHAVTRTYTRDGIAALEAYANHPAVQR